MSDISEKVKAIIGQVRNDETKLLISKLTNI